MTKHKLKASTASTMLFQPGAERAIVINVSARLRAFYDALAEIESKRLGRTVTRQELMRWYREQDEKKKP